MGHKDHPHDDTPHTGVRPGHSFPADCIQRAKDHFWTLNTSERYAFRGANPQLFAAMLIDDQRLKEEANRLFSRSAPTLTETGQTTDGEDISWVPGQNFNC